MARWKRHHAIFDMCTRRTDACTAKAANLDQVRFQASCLAVSYDRIIAVDEPWKMEKL
jgi:hypothetical protein